MTTKYDNYNMIINYNYITILIFTPNTNRLYLKSKVIESIYQANLIQHKLFKSHNYEISAKTLK